MELWDAYNSSFLKIENVTLVRGEPIPKDIFHLVCEILVKHVDGTFLLMKRDPQKHFGGMWEATAGGSALAGENSFQCAIRELREETGIISTELIEVGREVNDRTHSIYIEFLCVTDWNKDEVLLQEGETVDYAGLCEGGISLCTLRGFATMHEGLLPENPYMIMPLIKMKSNPVMKASLRMSRCTACFSDYGKAIIFLNFVIKRL